MPTTKRRVAVNLPDNTYDQLAALAQRYRVSMAWLGHQAILEFLDKYQDRTVQLPLKLYRSQRTETE